MIYNNPNTINETSNVILCGTEADSFLESYGITLFSDAVVIGEMVMDGITGENILAENGITLNEDHIVLEGKQAEEYKARKAKEEQAEDNRWESKYRQRMGGRSVKTNIASKDRPYRIEKSWNDDDPDYYKDFSTNSGGVDHNRVRKSNLSTSQKINHAAFNHMKYADAHQTVTKMADKRKYENKWANDNQKVNPINTKFNTAYAADSLARHERKQEKKNRSKQHNESTIFRYSDLVSE